MTLPRRALAALLFCVVPSRAADPDWPRWEQYATELLQRYVRIASVNPPADTRAAAELVRSELAQHGLDAKLYPSGPTGQTNLLVRLPGRDRAKKPLLLLNHLDVVPVDRAAWPVDPFGGEIRDGYLWGRGALDMKSTGVMQMVGLMLLHDLGVVPSRDIVMLCTADEETSGQQGIKWMIEHHYADFDPEYVLDEGGLGTRDLLAPGKLVFGVAVGEKRIAWLRIRAKGTAAHGSQPIPDNANLILLTAVQKALAIPPSANPNPVVAEMRRTLGALAQNKLTSAIQANTASLTTLRAGVGDPPKVNVIPSTSEATLDCRLLPGVNADEFVSDIRARINDPRVTVETINQGVDPGASPSDTPLFAALSQAIRRAHPDAVVTPMLVPYGTDSVNLRQKGVTAYGLIPMVLDAAVFATMHSDAERIPLAEFRRGLHIYYDVLRSTF